MKLNKAGLYNLIKEELGQLYEADVAEVVEKLNNIPGIACNTPKGAFYVYPSCAGCIGKKTPNGTTITSDENFMNYLLDSEGIAGVHGEAFGLSPYFRLSYATDELTLNDACDRIMKACKQLS